MELTAEEMRVLGCLAEKQLITPGQYPLTLNALTLACNQSTSREPVVSYDERLVEATVTRVKTEGWARFYHPSHGRSVLRFGHCLDEALGLDTRQLALMTVLMLRGPQTLAELRARTQRMAEFADTREVASDLDGLARREPPLVRRLGRLSGQKEQRYTQLVGPQVSAPSRAARYSGDDQVESHGGGDGAEPEGLHRPPPGSDEALVAQVADLQAEVASLRHDVDDLRSQLGI